ncbi:cell wall-active antibiotics response protein LiaF [Paenibacillus sp. NPDC058071]|uniref:cell wall-active antibiotics response protein LiaF n=1 Tax=Paenibacillus sp. NPDC058071 TaxID=3346326 RepID=UPI0036D8869E
MNGNFINRLFVGIIIIGIGVYFLLRQTGQIDHDIDLGYIFSTYWPVFLIYFGGMSLLSGLWSGTGSGWWGGLVLLIGLSFLGRNLGWFDWSIGNLISYFWPVAIILVGLNMLRRPRKKKHHHSEEEKWKSYTGYGEHGSDVPPAPPLHPDPTQAGDAETDGQTIHNNENKSAAWNEDAGSKKEHRRERRERRYHHGQSMQSGEYDYWNDSPDAQNRSNFIGDIHIGHDYWELKPMNISHFIGDTVLDLTKAQIPYGETKLTISSFVGDVKVYVPNDYEVGVQVISSAFVGDVKILGHKEGGFFKNLNIHSPSYHDTDKKIKLVVSTFVGDVRVTKVG